MTVMDWRPVERELDRWAAAGLTLPIAWRDDDAVRPTPALERLLERAAAAGAPLTLAVIPAEAEAALAERLARPDAAGVTVATHGWAHRNNAPASEKKAEFGAHRPIDALLGEIRRGGARVAELFGARARPVFVPPWNRIAPEAARRLGEAGIEALSTFGPRRGRLGPGGVARVNTHLDPIDFRGGGGMKDPAFLARKTAEQLTARRVSAAAGGAVGRARAAWRADGAAGGAKATAKRLLKATRPGGAADPTEPFGLLTHHLVHSPEIWAFVDGWIDLAARRRDVMRWVPLEP